MRSIIILLLFIPTIAFAGGAPCGNTHEKRVVKGLEPTATTLYQNLQEIESGAWKNGFWEETFSYIGEAHTRNGKIYKVGFLSTIWGESCRATNRLFIFNENNLCLGQYSGIMEPPVKISEALVYFPFDAQEGNTLNLENGPPEKVWLAGENPEWMPAKFSSKEVAVSAEEEACKKYEKSDKELNVIYNKIMSEYSQDTKFIEKLKIAQRAWVKFRDAHLESIFPEDDKKTNYGSVFSTCFCVYRQELTVARISELKKWLEGYEEGEVCSGSIKIKNK